jgi:hypothetical protein
MEIHFQELLDHSCSDLLWFSSPVWCSSFLCKALKQLICVNVPRKLLTINSNLTHWESNQKECKIHTKSSTVKVVNCFCKWNNC